MGRRKQTHKTTRMTKLKVAVRNFMNASKRRTIISLLGYSQVGSIRGTLYYLIQRLCTNTLYVYELPSLDAFRPFKALTSVNLFFVVTSPFLHRTYIQHCLKYT